MATKRRVSTGDPPPAAGTAPATKPKRTRKAAAARPASPAEMSESEREAVERLAYSYWMERGCPHGSHEEDWYRAEEEILRRRARAGEAKRSR